MLRTETKCQCKQKKEDLFRSTWRHLLRSIWTAVAQCSTVASKHVLKSVRPPGAHCASQVLLLKKHCGAQWLLGRGLSSPDIEEGRTLSLRSRHLGSWDRLKGAGRTQVLRKRRHWRTICLLWCVSSFLNRRFHVHVDIFGPSIIIIFSR